MLIVLLLISISGAKSIAQVNKIELLEKQLTNQTSKTTDRVNLLNELAYLYYPITPEVTKVYAEEALALSKELEYDSGLITSNVNLGISYWVQGYYDYGLEFDFEALRLIEESGINEKLSVVLNIVGLTYYEQNTYDIALEYFEKSLEVSKARMDSRQEAIVISNIGRVYKRKGELSAALDFLNQSLEMLEEVNDKVMLGNVLNTIGECYIEKKEYEKALQQLSAARTIGENVGVNQIKTATSGNMGVAYTKLGEYSKAEEYLNEALKISIQIKARDRELHQYLALSELYEKQGKSDKSLLYYKQYVIVKESVFNEVKNKQINQLKLQYDIERSEKEAHKLKAYTKDKEGQLKRQKILAYGAIAVLVITSALIFFILRVNRKIIKKNNLLEQQQKEIIEQSSKIEKGNREIVRQNQQLEMVNQKLIEINDEKNNLIDIVAHDLKSPINQILGIVGLIKASPETTKDDLNNYVNIIHESAKDSVQMIKKILDVHSIERGAVMSYLQGMEIIDIVKGKLKIFQIAAREKDISITFTKSLDQLKVKLDRTYFQQIVENLVSNSIKFSPMGKNVYIRLFTRGQDIVLEVEDEGPGLSEEDLQHLFKKFKTLSAKPSGGESSTGVGLSIVKKFTEEMNGKVWAESKEGHGAKFSVSFPFKNVSE